MSDDTDMVTVLRKVKVKSIGLFTALTLTKILNCYGESLVSLWTGSVLQPVTVIHKGRTRYQWL